MTEPLEAGFYWVSVDGGPSVVAQLVMRPLATLWLMPGDDSIVAYERGVVLSPRLVQPSRTPPVAPNILQVMNQLARHGEASIEALAQRIGCTPEAVFPFVDRLLGLRIVDCVDGELYRLVVKDCEHLFKTARNCVKCGISKDMLPPSEPTKEE